MLHELQHQILCLAATGPVQDACGGEHRDGVGAHPAGGVGLLKGVAGGQVGPVDRADVIQAEEAALKHAPVTGVLAVDPPGEVDQQLVEDPGQEIEVAAAVDGEHLQRRPRVHRRVDVAEVPLVRRQRPLQVLEPLPADQDQLVLGERRVQVRQGDGVEGQVPGGEPGILPLVRHRDDVEPVEVAPLGVPPALAHRRRFRLGRVPVQPAGDVVVEQLLTPQHPGGRLPQHQRLIRARAGRCQLGIELIGLGLALGHHLIEVLTQCGRRLGRGAPTPGCGRSQPEPQLGGLPGRHGDLVPERALGPGADGVDRGRAVDHVVVDAVLGIGRDRFGAVQPGQVGLVLTEQQLRAGPNATGSRRGWARRPGTTSTPSRPRRGCPAGRSARTGVP